MTLDLDAMERKANEIAIAVEDSDEWVGEDEAAEIADIALALIARVRELEAERETAVVAERKRCVEIARMFADENILMAGDTILMDPILSRARRKELGPVTAEECALSEKMQIEGCVHSAMYHAAKNIANAIERKAGSDTGTEK